MNKPYICGSNRMNLPESGCSDCDGLQYQIDQIKEWIQTFEEEGYDALANKPTINGVTVEGDKTSEDYLITPISTADIIELTPIECYVPPCQDSRACFGEACCMLVGCNESDSSIVCEGGVCHAIVSCDEPPTPPTPTPTASLTANIDLYPQSEEIIEGTVVEVIYTVANNGGVPLTNITVAGAKTGSQYTIEELAVGETATFGGGEEDEDKILYTINAGDIADRKAEFTLTASATYDGEAVTASDTKTIDLGGDEPKNPSLSVESAYSMESETAGSTVSLTHTISNNGDVAIDNVVATSNLTSDTWNIGTMAVGASVERTAEYTIKTSDATDGFITVDLSATGEYDGTTVTDNATEVITLGENEETA